MHDEYNAWMKYKMKHVEKHRQFMAISDEPNLNTKMIIIKY